MSDQNESESKQARRKSSFFELGRKNSQSMLNQKESESKQRRRKSSFFGFGRKNSQSELDQNESIQEGLNTLKEEPLYNEFDPSSLEKKAAQEGSPAQSLEPSDGYEYGNSEAATQILKEAKRREDLKATNTYEYQEVSAENNTPQSVSEGTPKGIDLSNPNEDTLFGESQTDPDTDSINYLSDSEEDYLEVASMKVNNQDDIYLEVESQKPFIGINKENQENDYAVIHGDQEPIYEKIPAATPLPPRRENSAPAVLNQVKNESQNPPKLPPRPNNLPRPTQRSHSMPEPLSQDISNVKQQPAKLPSVSELETALQKAGMASPRKGSRVERLLGKVETELKNNLVKISEELKIKDADGRPTHLSWLNVVEAVQAENSADNFIILENAYKIADGLQKEARRSGGDQDFDAVPNNEKKLVSNTNKKPTREEAKARKRLLRSAMSQMKKQNPKLKKKVRKTKQHNKKTSTETPGNKSAAKMVINSLVKGAGDSIEVISRMVSNVSLPGRGSSDSGSSRRSSTRSDSGEQNQNDDFPAIAPNAVNSQRFSVDPNISDQGNTGESDEEFEALINSIGTAAGSAENATMEDPKEDRTNPFSTELGNKSDLPPENDDQNQTSGLSS